MQINKECIEEIYRSHKLITDVYINTEESKFQITLFHNDNLVTETEIILEFKDNESLLPRINKKGNVVKIEIFVLVEKYRKKGICKSIHKKEVQFYKGCNIKQIQLKATYSGFFAWSKLGFLCGAEEENQAKGIMIAYLAQSTEMEVLSQVNLSSLLDEIGNKSDDFLKWADKTDTQIKIPMYKDI